MSRTENYFPRAPEHPNMEETKTVLHIEAEYPICFTGVKGMRRGVVPFSLGALAKYTCSGILEHGGSREAARMGWASSQAESG